MNPGSLSTAEAILQRLLVVLPVAARKEGAKVAELSAALGVEPRRLLRDLEELAARSYYLPPGRGDQIQLQVTREELAVWTSGEFQRPVRLGPREALALDLSLRVVARTAPEVDRPVFEALGERLVKALRTPVTADAVDPAVALGTAEAGPDPFRGPVESALRECRELRIRYCPPGRRPSSRRIGPVLLAHAEGRWYLLARDLDGGGPRAFRLDRVLSAEETGAPFAATPEDRDAAEAFIQDGRIHDGGIRSPSAPFQSVVEYSSRIARWIRERGWDGLEDREDGTVRVYHQVADPEWVLRHVLSYGPEAELVEPGWMRERVVQAAEALTAAHPPADPERERHPPDTTS